MNTSGNARLVVLVAAVLLFAAIVWRMQASTAGRPVTLVPSAVDRAASEPAPELVGAGRVAGVSPTAGSSSAPAGPAAIERLLVEVVDPSGSAVAGAEVFVVDADGTPLANGLADAAGQFPCALASRHVCLVVHVAAAGLAGREVAVAVPVPTSLQVQLAAPASLRGTVRTNLGLPPPQGTQVFAWTARTLGTKDFEHRRQAGFGLLTAVTESDGSFTVAGADPSNRYTVLAGCSGWVVDGRVRVAVDEACQLVVRPVYGCRIVARQAGGLAAPASVCAVVHFLAPELPGADALEFPSIELAVSGLDLAGAPRPGALHDWRDLRLVYTADDDLADLAGFRVQYVVPGFESRQFEVALPRLRGGWQEAVAELSPDGLGFGELEVVLQRTADDTRAFEGRLEFRIEIVPLSAQENAYAAPLYFERGRAIVPGLPFGVYDLRVASPYGWSFPVTGRTQLEIGHAPARLEIPAASFGSLRLTVTDHDSTTTSNALTLDLDLGGDRGAVRSHVRGPRAVLHGVKPGRGQIALVAEGDGGKSTIGPVDIEVLAGMIRDVDLAWGERR